MPIKHVTFDSWLSDEIAKCEREMRQLSGRIDDSPPYVPGGDNIPYIDWWTVRKRCNTLYDVLTAKTKLERSAASEKGGNA